LEDRRLLAAMPLITEFMAANDGVLEDEDGDNSDWLEIGNVGDAPADLTGWHLTDSAGNLTKWTLPAVTLDPGEYLVVFASSKDRAVAGMELHTNFALSAGGEFLALVEPNGSSIASQYAPEYPPQLSNISYGMRTVGGVVFPGDLRYFSPSTPGAANGEGYLGVVEEPQFSVPHGFYDSTQNITITTSTPGAQIRYTTNGSAPTASTGTVYSGPLSIGNMTVLRAAAFVPDYLDSLVQTQSYIFIDDVLTQSNTPAGYPTDWGTAPAFPIFLLPPFFTPADYGIDPEVVNNPAYTADFLAGLTSIPTVSVVIDVDDMFGSADGIYSHPWERGDLWERPTSIELIHPDGSDGFQIDAGLRILGNASRQPMLSPKHSLRVEFRSEYGASELEYPLYGAGQPDTFDSLVLRVNLSDSWVSPQGDQPILTFTGSQGRPRAQYARDNFTRQTHAEMGQFALNSNYVHVYVNGLYWGLHDMIERRDEETAASHLGGDPQDFDVLQDDVFGDSGTLVSGDTVAWDAMFALANSGLANDAQYLQIQEYLDIDKFIDYMNLHLYVGSQDWPYNNWTAVRKREAGGTFEFLVWDAEYVLHDPTTNMTGVDDSASPGQLFDALRNNAEFRLKFADRAHHFMFNEGLLTPAASTDRYLALVNQIDDAIVAESARWGDYRRDVHPFLQGPYELQTRDNRWFIEQDRLIEDYFPVRTTNVINQYIAAGLYPSVVAPSFNQHGGQISGGFELTMTAPAGTIYYTLDGSDPREPGGALSSSAIEYVGAETLTQPTHVNARVLIGGVWSAQNSADFTVEVAQVRISELMYNPAAPPPGNLVDKEEFEFVEIQNVGTTPVNLQGTQFLVGITFTFPSVVLPPGAFGVIVGNQTAFESRYGTGINVLGEYSGNLSNGGERIVLSDAFDQVMHDFEYDDGWHPTTDGGGDSLVIVDATDQNLSNWAIGTSWRASTNSHGSPGEADPLNLPATVTGRHLFYNNSIWDNEGYGYTDSSAIATNKTAYIPSGGTTTTSFSNMSSYTKGINGIAVDLAGTQGTISEDDFTVRMSGQFNAMNNSPGTWTAAPSFTLAVDVDTPVAGTNRYKLIWPDESIVDRYVYVLVEGNDTEGGFNTNTGLVTSDYFFFGNMIGDTGQDAYPYPYVNATDQLQTRANSGDTDILSFFDFNRDAEVNATDQLIVRDAVGNFMPYMIITGSGPFAPEGPGDGDVDDGSGSAVASALAGSGEASPLAPVVAASIEEPATARVSDRGSSGSFWQHLGAVSDPRATELVGSLVEAAETLALDEWLEGALRLKR
jgi:hypothetical protein